jgi:hypothetical protein
MHEQFGIRAGQAAAQGGANSTGRAGDQDTAGPWFTRFVQAGIPPAALLFLPAAAVTAVTLRPPVPMYHCTVGVEAPYFHSMLELFEI